MAAVNTDTSICDPYRPLFCFPAEADIADQAALLLIMACQANALRCWIKLKKGALIKVKTTNFAIKSSAVNNGKWLIIFSSFYNDH